MPQKIPAREITQVRLQAIFEYLPEPSSAWVGLRSFDYSSIDEQASRLFPWIKLDGYGHQEQVVSIEQPTKERLLEIGRGSYGTENPGHPGFTKPRIKVHKIYWDLRPDAEIDLFPGDFVTDGRVEIRCWGEEPEYLSRLRTELSRTGIRLGIKSNQR